MDLWSFSLSFYAYPGVQERALALQNRHRIEVTLLLWALWLDAQAIPYDATLWQQGVVKTRQLRWYVIVKRSIRRMCPRSWSLCRKKLLQWELKTEREVLDALVANKEGTLSGGSITEKGFCAHYLDGSQVAVLKQDMQRLLQQWTRQMAAAGQQPFAGGSV